MFSKQEFIKPIVKNKKLVNRYELELCMSLYASYCAEKAVKKAIQNAKVRAEARIPGIERWFEADLEYDYFPENTTFKFRVDFEDDFDIIKHMGLKDYKKFFEELNNNFNRNTHGKTKQRDRSKDRK